MTSDQIQTENNRDRVRRLLLEPLGFRFPKSGTGAKTPEKQTVFLNRICDDVAYLHDDELGQLCGWMQAKGEGAQRCFWPSFASFRGHAESVRARPIEDIPEIRGWFGSIEGPKAVADGTLVETYAFLTKHKRPPYLPRDRAGITAEAKANARRLKVIKRRRADGVFNPISHAMDRADLEFERAYLAKSAFVEELIDMVAEKKAGKGRAT